jgi:hypothetical protein
MHWTIRCSTFASSFVIRLRRTSIDLLDIGLSNKSINQFGTTFTCIGNRWHSEIVSNEISPVVHTSICQFIDSYCIIYLKHHNFSRLRFANL